MWEQIHPELPEDIAAKTTSVWLYPGIMQIGVMRESMLRPPFLWAQVLAGGFRNVRRAPALVTELQELLYLPTVFAEAESKLPRNCALLSYLGFDFVGDLDQRNIYQRSI
jgi:hypothetical protein